MVNKLGYPRIKISENLGESLNKKGGNVDGRTVWITGNRKDRRNPVYVEKENLLYIFL